MSTKNAMQTKIEEIAEHDAKILDFPISSKRNIYRRVTGVDFDDAPRSGRASTALEAEVILDAYTEHFWRAMSEKVEAEKRGADEGSEIRIPVGENAAITIDLDSNLYTGGDSDLVVFSFDDGTSTAQWITVPRSTALALGHALVGAFEGSEPEGLPGFQNRAEITSANR